MPYKYSCFIENKPEMREWLERLGYKPLSKKDDATTLITRAENGLYITKLGSPLFDNYIDCRNNPALFKALTAVRDDSDYMQWFTDGVAWWLFTHENAFEILGYKATLSELQERFKKGGEQ